MLALKSAIMLLRVKNTFIFGEKTRRHRHFQITNLAISTGFVHGTKYIETVLDPFPC